MEDLGPKFERATGQKLAITFATLSGVVKRVQNGETADVVVIPRQGIDGLREGRQGCCRQRDYRRPLWHRRGRSKGGLQARHLVGRSIEAHAARRKVDHLFQSGGRRRQRHPFRQSARSFGDCQRDETEDGPRHGNETGVLVAGRDRVLHMPVGGGATVIRRRGMEPADSVKSGSPTHLEPNQWVEKDAADRASHPKR